MKTYKDKELKYKAWATKEEREANAFTIEFAVTLGEEKVYLVAVLEIGNKQIGIDSAYEDMLQKLLDNQGKAVGVKIKIVNCKIVDFKIDYESLAELLNDERFKECEAVAWSSNTESKYKK